MGKTTRGLSHPGPARSTRPPGSSRTARPSEARLAAGAVLAAIDVGTNAVRLEMARPLPDGSIETLHQERDPVRPGEGLFRTGAMPPAVVERLLASLRRYAALCRRHRARVRAVATSAVREARNQEEIVARVRAETGLELEVVSGKEEARLICLGVLHGSPPGAKSLCIDVGGGSTEVASAVGETPTHLWSVAVGAVRLAELFDASGAVSERKLRVLREYVDEAVKKAIPAGASMPGRPRVALGSSGTARAVVGFAAAEGTAHATAAQLRRAVDRLVAMGTGERRRRFDPRRADIVVTGAVILEALASHLSLEALTAVDRGLRHGLLVELSRRTRSRGKDHSLADAARALGRRFHFDERHAEQVARLALALFDELGVVHGLPPGARPYLEAAALLHDIGNAVSYQKHHRHTQYLIRNADLPGLADHERAVVACVARFHRRSPPDRDHPALEGLTLAEARLVRKLATLLRIADSLDRSHHQPVGAVGIGRRTGEVVLKLRSRSALDLELWDVARETSLFRRVFGRRLRVEAGGA
jgi:exopolyphosphatase / guanosine-5'-triphosphate,3'-diphosphate pyrophosphatase